MFCGYSYRNACGDMTSVWEAVASRLAARLSDGLLCANVVNSLSTYSVVCLSLFLCVTLMYCC